MRPDVLRFITVLFTLLSTLVAVHAGGPKNAKPQLTTTGMGVINPAIDDQAWAQKSAELASILDAVRKLAEKIHASLKNGEALPQELIKQCTIKYSETYKKGVFSQLSYNANFEAFIIISSSIVKNDVLESDEIKLIFNDTVIKVRDFILESQTDEKQYDDLISILGKMHLKVNKISDDSDETVKSRLIYTGK